jgi:opacity protein-like surface antigen
LLAGVSISAASQARAAEPVPPTPPIAPIVQAEPYRWTGVYVGVGGGYGAAIHTIGAGAFDYTPGGLFQVGGIDGEIEGFDVFSIGNSIDMGGRGAIGTIEAGYDLQLGDRFVVGIVGDYTLSRIRSNISAWGDICYEPDDCDLPAVSDSPEVAFDFFSGNSWTVAARFGFLNTPRSLIYGLAGYTNAGVYGVGSISSIPTGDVSESTDVARVGGFTFGAGIETLLSEHVSAKLEYRGTMWSVGGDTGGDMGLFAFADSFVQSVRATIAVRLGSGDAVLPEGGFDGEGHRWTGFHVGAGGGYGLVGYTLGAMAYDYGLGGLFQVGGPTGFDVYAIGNSIDFGGRGAIATIDGGFDFQIGDRFVVGLIGDYTFSWIDSNASLYGEVCYETAGPDDCDTATISDEVVLAFDFTTLNSWSVGGRAGFTVGGRTLIYGLAAYTQQRMIAIASIDSGATGYLATASDPITVASVSLGAGVETMLTQRLSMKLEYRGTYWSVGGQTDDPTEGFGAFAQSLEQTVRATLSLRFGGNRD